MSIPITVTVGEPIYPPPRPPLWRVKHDRELGPLWRPNLPEIHPFFPSHFVPFTAAWQRHSFGMNTMNKNEWTSVFSDTTAFVNNQGFGKPGDPRANFIKQEDLREDLPKLEALICGGAVMTGHVEGANLIVYTLNGKNSPPRRVLEPWEMYHAITVDRRGTPRMFPQGDGQPVLLALVADRDRYPVVTFPMYKLERVPDNAPIPSPYF